MDEIALRIAAHIPQQPQYDQYHGNRPQHVPPPSPRRQFLSMPMIKNDHESVIANSLPTGVTGGYVWIIL
jgi:hypothetical protein